MLLPKQCPRCHSAAWNREPNPIHRLQPKQFVTIPWQNTATTRDFAANTRIQKAAQRYARRHGWVLRWFPTSAGMEFYRVS